MIKIIQYGSEKRFFQTCQDCQTDYTYQTEDIYQSGTVSIPPHTVCPKCKSLNVVSYFQTCINIEGKRPEPEEDPEGRRDD